MYDRLHRYSKSLMTQTPVHLPVVLRSIVLDAVIASLKDQGIVVAAGAMDNHHLHLLAKFPDDDPRMKLAIAKHFTTRMLKAYLDAHPTGVGFSLPLGTHLWAKRSKAQPIRDRAHQLNTVRYILAHAARGAAVWKIAPSS